MSTELGIRIPYTHILLENPKTRKPSFLKGNIFLKKKALYLGKFSS
jgi:hypothetical protein